MAGAASCAVFDLTLIDQRPGRVVFRVSGQGAGAAFANESGGHRWQRVPPTERRGRVHTSTITVAVLPEPTQAMLHIADRDITWKGIRGSGPGGQHRNKTASTVQLTHLPTGLMVRCDGGRSQHQNLQEALALLRARLWQTQRQAEEEARDKARKAQMGSGERGDKRRTIRCQDGAVVDHVLGQRWPLARYLRGDW